MCVCVCVGGGGVVKCSFVYFKVCFRSYIDVEFSIRKMGVNNCFYKGATDFFNIMPSNIISLHFPQLASSNNVNLLLQNVVLQHGRSLYNAVARSLVINISKQASQRLCSIMFFVGKLKRVACCIKQYNENILMFCYRVPTFSYLSRGYVFVHGHDTIT